MKKNCIGLSLLLLISTVISAQKDSTSAPLPAYKSFPGLPPFKLLLTDSTTWFTKDDVTKRKALIIIFSPDCEHCQHETEELVAHINDFKKTEIIMATPLPFEKMKEFYGHYDLGRFKNIIVGRDVSYLLPVFYNVKNLPYLAFYDKKGNLIDTFEGSLPMEKVLEKFNQQE